MLGAVHGLYKPQNKTEHFLEENANWHWPRTKEFNIMDVRICALGGVL